ncbi:hypothetical protein AD947_07370 [Acetobacter tropicalis]|uniref:Uncharacterized protein n=1 Tax=Acetobacter tropicalis TaxID=104102 RepID=A0A149TXW4_9PROT|nr:hypothetical protein [Acetobacter tropicalis]KXV58001.1 hypothetical protein AD947_07370 [Acetobacter tropicalis]
MTIRTNPSLGFSLDTVLPADGSWLDVDGNVSPQYGDVSFDEDGYKRVWVTSAAALTAGAKIGIDDNGNASAADTGAYTAPAAVPAGGSFWAKAAAI